MPSRNKRTKESAARRAAPAAVPAPKPEMAALPSLQQAWGRQFVGAAVGGALMWLVLQIGPGLGWQPGDPMAWLLAGAAVGATLASLSSFVLAGSRLTQRQGPQAFWLNLGVSLLVILVVFGLIVGVIALIGVWAR